MVGRTTRRADRRPRTDRRPGARASLAVLAGVGVLALAVPVTGPVSPASATAPATAPATASTTTPVDAIYATPSPIPRSAPGTVVRTEPMPAPFAGARAWRVMYTSRGIDGVEPVVVTGMVVAPTAPAPPGSRPVVSWAHPTSGIVDKCAPSRSPKPYGDVQGLAEFIRKGWVVAATDYQGLGTDGPHPYLVGTSEAHGVLDAVRAAIAIPETAAGPDTFVWGHSQGGQAVLFAARLAPTYAPELRLRAAAAAAPAGILTEQFALDRDSIAGSVLGSFAVIAWSEVFGYDPATVVRPLFLGRVRSVAGRCVIGGGALSDATLTADALVLQDRMWSADPATTSPWKEQFVTNTPTPPVVVPVLVTQGTKDQVVRPPTTARLVERFRAAGTDVEERMLPGVNHLKAGKVSAPIVARWFTRIDRSA